MQKHLTKGGARPDSLRALDKARIAKKWQQDYEYRVMSYGGFRRVRRHESSPGGSWRATPEGRNELRSSTGGAGRGEIRFTFSNSVSTSSELTSRKRLLPWLAAPISSVRQAAYHCWAALVFIRAICTPFSSAEQDKECMPFSLTESSIC